MYECIGDDLTADKVAIELGLPKWMNVHRKKVEEGDEYSCKITHSIKNPDICIVVDEVGGNRSQKKEGIVGG